MYISFYHYNFFIFNYYFTFFILENDTLTFNGEYEHLSEEINFYKAYISIFYFFLNVWRTFEKNKRFRYFR